MFFILKIPKKIASAYWRASIRRLITNILFIHEYLLFLNKIIVIKKHTNLYKKNIYNYFFLYKATYRIKVLGK